MDRVEAPPDVVIKRLPLYARSLRYLLQEDITSVSSQELGDRIHVTAAQIRKDLSYFGEFGKQGIGYDVEKLLAHIERILGLTQEWPMALVGVGHLGEAIARYEGFLAQGLRVAAIFDANPAKVGTELNGIVVHHDSDMVRMIRAHDIKVAIIAVPAERAQDVTATLVTAGVRAILSYAPIILQVPEHVWVRYIDPVAILHSMTYYLAREEETP